MHRLMPECLPPFVFDFGFGKRVRPASPRFKYPHHTSCNASLSPPPDHTTIISLSVSSRYWRSFATCSSTERRDEPPSVSRDSADFS